VVSCRPCTGVLASGHDCDLSVLTVEDEEFWNSPDLPAMMPLEFGGVPQLQAGGPCCCLRHMPHMLPLGERCCWEPPPPGPRKRAAPLCVLLPCRRAL
jgi:hypothetical protein